MSMAFLKKIFVFHLPIKNKCIDNKRDVNSSLKKIF